MAVTKVWNILDFFKFSGVFQSDNVFQKIQGRVPKLQKYETEINFRHESSRPGLLHLKTGNFASKMIVADDVLGTICMLIESTATDDDVRDRMCPIPY